MQRLVVTTAVKAKEDMLEMAHYLSNQWKIPFISRQKKTIQQLTAQYGNVFVVYSDKLEYIHDDGTRLFFHPNTAVIRIKSGRDPLATLVGSQKVILDCTMGLAGDSIVMAAQNNQVVAVEHDPIIYTIVQHGLTYFTEVSEAIKKAMHSITCVHDDFFNYLIQADDNSVDVVYFDPMFIEKIAESQNFSGVQIRQSFEPLSDLAIEHAKRVCRESVIIKAHFRDPIFERLGFERLIRPNTKFHYGIWRKTN